ncbi:hypothetical protein K438DRAFT_824381 [Mycena galopus ATCC 62051]|nr:hypothetical protein K438DRAFT_824381 [Mycena galopus ATCC 62051]
MQASAGLQVKSPTDEWVDVPVLPNAFVINVSDMFDQLTAGRLPSRAHRVLPPSPSAGPRFSFSFPIFFDFAWNAHMAHLDAELAHLPPMTPQQKTGAEARWTRGTFKRRSRASGGSTSRRRCRRCFRTWRCQSSTRMKSRRRVLRALCGLPMLRLERCVANSLYFLFSP